MSNSPTTNLPAVSINTARISNKTHVANITVRSTANKIGSIATLRAFQIGYVKNGQVLPRRSRFVGVMSVPCSTLSRAQQIAASWLNTFAIA